MAFSSRKRKVDKDNHLIDDDKDDDDNKTKYIKIWRIEASREFILLMAVVVMAIGFSIINPLKLMDIVEQNKVLNSQSLANTDRIIEYLNISDSNRTTTSMDLVKILLLYNQDHERDLAKLLNAAGLPNRHFVDINGTHVITESAVVELPAPLNISGFESINKSFINSNHHIN